MKTLLERMKDELRQEMRSQNVSISELARRLDKSPREIRRMLNTELSPHLDTFAAAFWALGKRIDLTVKHRHDLRHE